MPKALIAKLFMPKALVAKLFMPEALVAKLFMPEALVAKLEARLGFWRGAIQEEGLWGLGVVRVSCRSFLGRAVLCFEYGFESGIWAVMMMLLLRFGGIVA